MAKHHLYYKVKNILIKSDYIVYSMIKLYIFCDGFNNYELLILITIRWTQLLFSMN